jgi:hypothetical protein
MDVFWKDPMPTSCVKTKVNTFYRSWSCNATSQLVLVNQKFPEKSFKKSKFRVKLFTVNTHDKC